MSYIVAIGGYEFEDQAKGIINTPLSIDEKIVSLSGKKQPNVLFLPTASSDSIDYVKSIENIYLNQLKTNFDYLLLHNENVRYDEIKQKIEWADIVYVGGGNTMMMIAKWKELGVDTLLKEAYMDGKIMCGVSAGSICWFEYGISDSLHFYDKNTKEYINVDGLGFIPGGNCPHFQSKLWDKGYRTDGMKKIMKSKNDKCLAIFDGSAVVFKDGKVVESIGLEPSYNCFWDNENWVEHEL